MVTTPGKHLAAAAVCQRVVPPLPQACSVAEHSTGSQLAQKAEQKIRALFLWQRMNQVSSKALLPECAVHMSHAHPG